MPRRHRQREAGLGVRGHRRSRRLRQIRQPHRPGPVVGARGRPVIAEALGMETGDDVPMLLHKEMPKQSALWEGLVSEHGLQQNSMQGLVGDSFYYADFSFAHGLKTSAPPALVSTIKAREFGFHDCIDTEDMLRWWFQYMQDRRIIPPADWQP